VALRPDISDSSLSILEVFDVVRRAPGLIFTMMHYQFWIFRRLVIALIPAILAQADYIIDDSNSTISYIGPGWHRVIPNEVFPMTAPQLFNGTA
jgi:hypothetical protein